MKIKLLSKIIFGMLVLLAGNVELLAQITPFSLPPRWYFGHRMGLDFTGGGAPVTLAGNVWDGHGGAEPAFDNQEGATTECLPNGNVAFYSNSCRLKSGAHVLQTPSPPGPDANTLFGGGNSSTQGVISIPNPANPNNSYYLITATVDGSGGSNCAQPNYGIYVYPVTGAGVPGAPTNLATGQASSSGPRNESIAVSSDMEGGYWIVTAHYNVAGTIQFASWHILNTGVINTTTVISPATPIVSAAWTFQPQGSIVINKCNNRIGYVQHGTSGTGSDYWVYNWNPATGQATTLVRTGLTGNGFNYGCEFSADGNMLYTTGLNGGDGLRQINLTTGAVQTLAAASIANASIQGWGNLKIGPDNRIYVSHAYSAFEFGPKYLGVINNPNSTTVAGASYVATGHTMAPNAAAQYPSTQRGLITLGWHNPNLLIAGATSPSCMSMSYTYNQYYGTPIPVLANSEEWDFGHGGGWQTGLGATPTHVFPADGNYTVRLRVRDSYCQTFYTSQRVINVNCPAPVDFLSFTGKTTLAGVVLTWQTAMELNNDYFAVQRSTDGVNFETIGTVRGVGNSKSVRSYQHTDASARGPQVYYRLVQYDFDGTSHTSNIITVKLDRNFDTPVSLMPNPFSGSVTLTKFNREAATVLVYDVYGRLVEQTVTGEDQSTLQLGHTLANGSYIVQYVTSTDSYTLRVEKK